MLLTKPTKPEPESKPGKVSRRHEPSRTEEAEPDRTEEAKLIWKPDRARHRSGWRLIQSQKEATPNQIAEEAADQGLDKDQRVDGWRWRQNRAVTAAEPRTDGQWWRRSRAAAAAVRNQRPATARRDWQSGDQSNQRSWWTTTATNCTPDGD
jgi:hypothetical protein